MYMIPVEGASKIKRGFMSVNNNNMSQGQVSVNLMIVLRVAVKMEIVIVNRIKLIQSIKLHKKLKKRRRVKIMMIKANKYCLNMVNMLT